DTIFVDPGDDIIMTRVGPDMGTIAGQGNYWEAAALDMDRFSPWGLVNTAQNDPNANTLADFDDWFAGQNEYTQALDYYSNSEFEEAYEVFSEIVEEYPNSRVAANSYARMLNCAIEMEMNLESFGSFIDNIEIDEDVEFVISKRNHASNMVLVELEEFDEAIENFTSQFENAESRNDSIGIAMDIAYVEHRRDRGRDQNELNSLGSDFISRLHELHELRDKPGTIIELNPPKDFGLISCYPNPFNSTTTIKYNLTESVHVALTMHDLNGRQVAVFANEVQSAGIRSVTFQAGDLPSGLYFCRMEAGGMTDIQKLTLIR
ncbi:T9SS type A sorting domain-containing protein, partial [bacterium]|nr:T9SS type A sorting domain-containing protein [bacterium]